MSRWSANLPNWDGKDCSSVAQNYDVVAGLFEAYAAEDGKFSAHHCFPLPFSHSARIS